MRKGLIAASLGLLAAAVIVTSALAKSESAATPAQVAACTNVSLGFLGPLTGPAAFLGQEQISWLRFGAQKYNTAERDAASRSSAGDTQLKAPVARTVARRFVSNQNIMAVIGGSESQAVTVSGNLFEKAALASVSGSATAVDLTKGRPFTTFFRVVPHDGIQGPQIVTFVAGNLKAKNVVVIDSQDDYSVPLASGVSRGLRARNVNVERESVSADDTDFSSIVANVGNDVDVVVFATQVAPRRTRSRSSFASRARRRSCSERTARTRRRSSSRGPGTSSVFAPDIHFDPRARALVREYNRYSKNKAFGSFGPATYMAGLVAMNAITKACADGYCDASRSRRAGAPDEHPVDLRRHGPVLREGRPAADAVRASTRSRTGSTARPARAVATRTARPTGRAVRVGCRRMR